MFKVPAVTGTWIALSACGKHQNLTLGFTLAISLLKVTEMLPGLHLDNRF